MNEPQQVSAPATGRSTAVAAFAAVTVLFFAWGFITSLIDPLVAAVKGIFTLSDAEAQLSASAFFIAYGLMSFPAAALIAPSGAAQLHLPGMVGEKHSEMTYGFRGCHRLASKVPPYGRNPGIMRPGMFCYNSSHKTPHPYFLRMPMFSG